MVLPENIELTLLGIWMMAACLMLIVPIVTPLLILLALTGKLKFEPHMFPYIKNGLMAFFDSFVVSTSWAAELLTGKYKYILNAIFSAVGVQTIQ